MGPAPPIPHLKLLSASGPTLGWREKYRRHALPKSNPILRRNRGFTIVEVMMAATILVVGFIGMIEAMTLGSSMMDTARRQTLATQIINHEIERLRFSDWTTVSGLPTASTTITIDDQFTAAIAASGANYTLARTVTSPDPATNLREVNFVVTWVVTTSRRTAGGSPLSFTYTRSNSAYFGKNGLNLSYQRS